MARGGRHLFIEIGSGRTQTIADFADVVAVECLAEAVHALGDFAEGIADPA